MIKIDGFEVISSYIYVCICILWYLSECEWLVSADEEYRYRSVRYLAGKET